MQLSLQQIGLWLGCRVDRSVCVSGYRQDSRLVQQGDLFFAISGEKVDGHSYLKEVADRGAVAAVVSLSYQGEDFGLQLFPVQDVLQALHQLAAQVHRLYPCRIIGVTGSVGKTTTKEFISELLDGHFRVGKTPGNANSQVGMPLGLLNARGDEEVFVVEMGMSSAGEIARLVQIAPPEIALITKIALAHVSFFSDGLQGIARAKAEIFSDPSTRIKVVNAQALPFFDSMKDFCSYGTEDGCDFQLYSDKSGCWIREKGEDGPLLHFPFSATHLRENGVAAIVIARKMGLSWSNIQERLNRLHPFRHRFEWVEKEGIVFVDDSYNANPTSMKAALHNLPCPHPERRRLAVLGAMKELGVYEKAGHIEVGQEAVKCVDHVLCLGLECQPIVDLFREKGKSAELFTDLLTLKQRLFELTQQGDVVLLKGSNSNQLWKILD